MNSSAANVPILDSARPVIKHETDVGASAALSQNYMQRAFSPWL
jgi:hypothetical protein